MPSPRVFVSSTCYDLKYIRENLKFFIRGLGYEPILSEEGAVFFDPNLHVEDACLAEIPSCQIFVLIIGGRYGSEFQDTDRSITNVEFREAVKSKIPIFALVEREVYDQYRVYQSNKVNQKIDENQISYPAVDSTEIFAFIEEVKGQVSNNAIVPFSDFEEFQKYLKQQWASMVYKFLTSESEAKRVGDVLSTLSTATERIEFISKQIVETVAEPMTKLNIEFYDIILEYESIRDIAYWNLRPSPKLILENKTLDELCDNKIIVDEYDEPGSSSITGGGPPYRISEARLEFNREQYLQVRERLIKKLKEEGKRLKEFLSQV